MAMKSLLLAAASVALLATASVANAQVNVSIGGPPVIVGWHGDRYYDGHRYWGRDEWNRRHRRPPPRRFHDRPHGGWHGDHR